MTPKEKAAELVEKCSTVYNGIFTDPTIKTLATFHAVIAVDEILNNFGLTSDGKHFCNYSTLEYYEQVKAEIQAI